MRFSLLAFALFAFTLVGCADDFVGPEAPLTGTEAVASQTFEPSSPLFSTWIARDERTTYFMTLEPSPVHSPIESSDPGPSSRLNGTFSYRSVDAISASSNGRIVDAYLSDSGMSFSVADSNDEAMAQVDATIVGEFDALAVKIQFADGSIVEVPFERSQAEISL